VHATSTQVHHPLRPQPQLTLNEHHRPYAHSRSSPYYITTSALHSTQLTLTTMHRTLPRPTLLPLYPPQYNFN
jgi:hypothetical protein